MRVLLIITWTIWLLIEILFGRIFRSGKDHKQGLDKKSLLYIWITILFSIGMAVFAATISIFQISLAIWPFILGVILIYTGIVFRYIAIRTLGKYFTVDVAIHKDHQLIRHGFYRYLRHPSYTGSLITFLGFGFSLNNYLSLALGFLPVLISMIYRIRIEEKVLVCKFRTEYKEYQKDSWRLIPWIY